jgi:hypothetical protein
VASRASARSDHHRRNYSLARRKLGDQHRSPPRSVPPKNSDGKELETVGKTALLRRKQATHLGGRDRLFRVRRGLIGVDGMAIERKGDRHFEGTACSLGRRPFEEDVIGRIRFRAQVADLSARTIEVPARGVYALHRHHVL